MLVGVLALCDGIHLINSATMLLHPFWARPRM
jgi:hypothetical protein